MESQESTKTAGGGGEPLAVCGAEGPGGKRCRLLREHGAREPHQAFLESGAVPRWDYLAPATITVNRHLEPKLFETLLRGELEQTIAALRQRCTRAAEALANLMRVP